MHNSLVNLTWLEIPSFNEDYFKDKLESIKDILNGSFIEIKNSEVEYDDTLGFTILFKVSENDIKHVLTYFNYWKNTVVNQFENMKHGLLTSTGHIENSNFILKIRGVIPLLYNYVDINPCSQVDLTTDGIRINFIVKKINIIHDFSNKG